MGSFEVMITWVILGGDSRLTLVDLGRAAGSYDVTLQSDYPRNVAKLEQTMDGPCPDYVWRLVESARGKALVRRCLNLLVSCEPLLSIFGKVKDSTCLLVDCFHKSWPSQPRVILLSPFLKFHSSVRLSLPRYSQSAPPFLSVSDDDCFPSMSVPCGVISTRGQTV